MPPRGDIGLELGVKESRLSMAHRLLHQNT
jgi:hypothetical protein